MVALNQFNIHTTSSLIENSGKDFIEPLRPYLGMSQLGHNCERYLWFTFRWCYRNKVSARLKRLFNRGHLEEKRFIHELEKIGIRCWHYNDEIELVMAHGHCKGHSDGKCLGVIEAPKTIHLTEFKTMSDKYFKEVCKKGVKEAKPIYYAQTQIYMYKENLTRCLFGAVNKNDDSLYWERIKLDKGFAQDLERKAERIILSEEPPKKQFKPTWFECKWCDAKDICHGSKEVEENCRTCANCDLLPDGKWSCNYYEDLIIHTEQQRLGCRNYKILNCLEKG